MAWVWLSRPQAARMVAMCLFMIGEQIQTQRRARYYKPTNFNPKPIIHGTVKMLTRVVASTTSTAVGA